MTPKVKKTDASASAVAAPAPKITEKAKPVKKAKAEAAPKKEAKPKGPESRSEVKITQREYILQ